MPEIPVESAADPRLRGYHDLKHQSTERLTTFIAEGEKLVRRLLESGCRTESLVCTPTVLERLRPAIPADVPVYVVATPLISELIGYQFHRGALGCGRIPAATSLGELCAAFPPGEPALLVVCPELRDPTNLGTIIRTAAGFGAGGLIAGATGVSPWSRRVLRTSMGSVLSLPIVQSDDWPAVLETLHAHDFETIATVLAADAEPLRGARFAPRRALLLGNEDAGLPPDLAARCRRRVTLPMAGGIDSLNVAVAAGIAMYELAPPAASSPPGPSRRPVA